MTLSDYLADKKRGELMRLVRVSGLDYTTVWKIARTDHRLRDYQKAKALSLATNGLVSVEALCEPAPVPVAPTGTDG